MVNNSAQDQWCDICFPKCNCLFLSFYKWQCLRGLSILVDAEKWSPKAQPRLLWLQCWFFWRGSEFPAKGSSEVQVELHGSECLKSREFISSSFRMLIFLPLHGSSWGCRNAAMCRLQPSPRQAGDSGLCILWGISLDERKHDFQEAAEAGDKCWRRKTTLACRCYTS